MDNEPEIEWREEGKLILTFPAPPTQEQFDYWAAFLHKAVAYANHKAGTNYQILKITINEES